MTNNGDPKMRRMAPLATPSDQEPDAVRNIAGALNSLLADTSALYLPSGNVDRRSTAPRVVFVREHAEGRLI